MDAAKSRSLATVPNFLLVTTSMTLRVWHELRVYHGIPILRFQSDTDTVGGYRRIFDSVDFVATKTLCLYRVL